MSSGTRPLRGYRIRVTVDLPIYEYDKDRACQRAVAAILKVHSASKILRIKVIEEGLPDLRILFKEDQLSFNPSRRETECRLRIKQK